MLLLDTVLGYPPRVLMVLAVFAQVEREHKAQGMTYRGLSAALGGKARLTYGALRLAVLAAKNMGVVQVQREGGGLGNAAVFALTPKGRAAAGLA